MDIIDKIFQNKPEIKKQFEILYSKYKNSFNKVLTDKDQINRVSFISEVRFGFYLNKRFSFLKYNPTLLKKTPDWVTSDNLENIIFEVKQLNPDNTIFEDRINQVKNNNYKGITSQTIKLFSVKDIFPYLPKIMEKEKKYRHFIQSNNYKLVICINFTNLKSEFFTDKDLEDYLNLKDNYHYFLQEIEYLDKDNFDHFCKNVAGFLVIPKFGSEIFFIENKMCLNGLSKETIKHLDKTFDNELNKKND